MRRENAPKAPCERLTDRAAMRKACVARWRCFRVRRFRTTELATDPSPPGSGFVYDRDTSVLADGKTRVLGYTCTRGKGGVAYIALGHCHSPTNNRQRVVDASVQAIGNVPQLFRGPWETAPFEQLLRNGITWGIGWER